MKAEATANDVRKTGISVVGDVPWGSHICHFYETKEDLLDILVPYFKAGLENNEFCIWVVSDPLVDEEARNALKRVIPEAERYLATGHMEIVPHTLFPISREGSSWTKNIEIIPHTDWYLKDSAFIAERVLDGWNQKLSEALARGYAGLRANGNEAWLTKDNWKAFSEYEKTLDENLAGKRMVVLCSYPVTGASAAQIFDVVKKHQFGIVRRRGQWEIVETPELIQAKSEIKKLNDELEKKVEERTRALRTEIAERQLAEEEVKRAENRIRLVIDTIPAMAWSLRPDGAVDFVNQRWLDYTGLSFEDAMENPQRAIHPDDIPKVIEKWRQAQAAGKPYEDERRLRRADGEYRWFMTRTVPLRDQHGTIVEWYGTSTDIEDRKRAETKLRVLIDAIPQQIWSGPADGTLDYCNERWRSYMGLELQDLRGDGWQAMLHPEDRDRVLTAWYESVANGTPYEQEERHRAADGTYRWFLARGLPLRDAEGRIVRWYGTNTDIEDRKRADQKVEDANHQLRSLSRRLLHVQEEERRHLARELHDEIGQALTAAKINTDMLRSVAPNDLCARLDENAAILDRLLQQTRQISLDLRPPVLDDLGLVAALRWYVDQQAKRAGLLAKFAADARADEASGPIQIACFRLAQEAITNAIRHARATTLTLELRCRYSSLSLRVQDDGVGFDVAKAEARAEQGGSLGLIGIKERAALAGGRVRIVSTPGAGTTLDIRLPLQAGEAAQVRREISAAE